MATTNIGKRRIATHCKVRRARTPTTGASWTVSRGDPETLRHQPTTAAVRLRNRATPRWCLKKNKVDVEQDWRHGRASRSAATSTVRTWSSSTATRRRRTWRRPARPRPILHPCRSRQSRQRRSVDSCLRRPRPRLPLLRRRSCLVCRAAVWPCPVSLSTTSRRRTFFVQAGHPGPRPRWPSRYRPNTSPPRPRSPQPMMFRRSTPGWGSAAAARRPRCTWWRTAPGSACRRNRSPRSE